MKAGHGPHGIRHASKRHGRAVIGVSGDGKTPLFACSLERGYTFKHAEILMVWLAIEGMQEINAVGHRVKAGQTFTTGQPTTAWN